MQYMPLKYEENNKNNKNIYELQKEKNKFDHINLNDNEENQEKCESLKKLEEIENDLVEISENIVKIYLKLDSSLIQDEKYLIDSLVIEAKKKGFLEDNFEISEEKNDKQEKPLESSSHKENKKMKYNNIPSNNKNKVNMREIYNFKQNENSNIYKNNIKNNYFPYDPNKHKAYYESLNNKMMKSNESNASNRSNYLKSNIPVPVNSVYQNENNKVYNYQMDNNANKEKFNNYNYNNENIITNPYNVNNNISNNISNNLLSSTDTTGPYRYMRKNRKDEPNLIDLLMEK